MQIVRRALNIDQCFMSMFKSCPSLCWECTPMLVPSPAASPPASLVWPLVHVCKGSLNSVCKPSLALLQPRPSCPARGLHCGLLSNTISQWGARMSALDQWETLKLSSSTNSSHRPLQPWVFRFGWRVQLGQWERDLVQTSHSLTPDNPDRDSGTGHCPVLGSVLLLDANIAKLTR